MSAALNLQVHDSADAAAQASALAQAVAAQLRQAISERGQALLAVSGGRSPVAFLQALRQQPLPWAQVTVLLADERCVPPTHPDRNAQLLRLHLLQGPAAAARLETGFDELPHDWQVPPADAMLTALTQACERRLKALAWPLDVLVLGMGEDGHTASLFAGAAGLAQALHGPGHVAWVRPLHAPHARLSLSLPVLQQARHAHLALSGAAKAHVLAQAMAQASEALPVSQVLRRPGEPLQVWRAP